MRSCWVRSSWSIATIASLPILLGGCPSADDIEDILDELDLDDIELRIDANVDQIQIEDPRFVELPDDLNETVIINNNVTIINNIQEDIVIEELPDVTLLGFENLTGFDGYYQYFVDGDLQGIFVFDGETLLLEYPCLTDIELASEEYFDPFTGVLEESFEIDNAFFERPADFDCGDAFIVTFTDIDISVDALAIDLLN
ncbi:MAG: hypothetical protein JNG88_15390 [Phycisphaerales bacterium]|nr:hypothetical protein [Phycisphaerales bacterium]